MFFGFVLRRLIRGKLMDPIGDDGGLAVSGRAETSVVLRSNPLFSFSISHRRRTRSTGGGGMNNLVARIGIGKINLELIIKGIKIFGRLLEVLLTLWSG
jgi:hypothetical protein